MGLKGALIWQVPPEHLRFTTGHYDDLWAAAEDLGMPVSLHILSGFNYSSQRGPRTPIEAHRNSVNTKVHDDQMTTVFDLVFSGALQRFPNLKFVLVENEVGWIPFLAYQWDRYVQRFGSDRPISIDQLPSFYVGRQGLRHVYRRPPRFSGSFFLGAGQLDVVKRLSPRRLDLAEFPGTNRP